MEERITGAKKAGEQEDQVTDKGRNVERQVEGRRWSNLWGSLQMIGSNRMSVGDS